MVSDFRRPRTRGGGGVKKGQIFADVLYGWPLVCFRFDWIQEVDHLQLRKSLDKY